MPTTTLGIWTPDDGDDWDLTVDLAAFALSVDAVIKGSSPVTVADQAARDSLYPSPIQGNSVHRLDRGWTERYFGLYNATTNPGGASSAGWYPVSGKMPYAVARGVTTAGVTHSSWSIGAIGFTPTGSFEFGGFTASGASNYYVGVPFPGLYDIQAYASFSSSANGSNRAVRITLDNATVIPAIYEVRRHLVSGSAYAINGSFLSTAVGTNVQLQLFQDSGGSLNTTDRVLSLRYLGPTSVIQNPV